MSILSSVIVNIPTSGPVSTAIAIAICGCTVFAGVTLGVALFHPDDDDLDDARRFLTTVIRAITRRSK